VVRASELLERAAERYVAAPDRELGPELWDALGQEAEAEGLALELSVAHAAMLLAAELAP
jgi:hypothetical protein